MLLRSQPRMTSRIKLLIKLLDDTSLECSSRHLMHHTDLGYQSSVICPYNLNVSAWLLTPSNLYFFFYKILLILCYDIYLPSTCSNLAYRMLSPICMRQNTCVYFYIRVFFIYLGYLKVSMQMQIHFNTYQLIKGIKLLLYVLLTD